MKTKLAFFAAAAALGAIARGAETAATNSKAPCCPVEAKPAVASCCAEEKPAAPLTAKSLYQLEPTWTDDAGQPVKLASFRGKPVVLAMFFASCEYACPVLTSDMQRLRELLPADVRAQAQFVLVSFDPARDTPAALKNYRVRASLNDPAWHLLRGDADSVQELAMLLGVKFKQDARGQFSHSNLITVLNAEGEITHQRAGLMGDVSEAAKAVTLALR